MSNGTRPPQGGIDQVRSVSARIQFDQVHPRFRLFVPNADRGRMIDVLMSLNGCMNSYLQVSGVFFHFPNDVRLSLVGQLRSQAYSQDITSYVLQELRQQLNSGNEAVIRESYRAGMYRWTSYLQERVAPFLDDSAVAQLKSDRTRIDSLAATQPASRLLTTLGDKTCGFRGGLHIFNYLYEYIPLQAISLTPFLAQQSLTVSDLSSIALECEEEASNIADCSGAVAVCIESLIHNPLRDQLADLQKTISTSLDNIEVQLDLNGDIMQSLTNAHDQLLKLQNATESFERQLVSSLAELQQLKASVTNLGLKIDSTLTAPPRTLLFPRD